MNEGDVTEGGVSEGGGTCAQKMRTQSQRCVSLSLSAYIMRGCVFCAYYAQRRMMRMCACALLRIMRILCIDAQMMRICAYYA